MKPPARLLVPLILSCVFIASCADSAPQLSAVDAVVVFDFKDDSSPPLVRLSVFAETESDVRRARGLSAIHLESGLRWTCPAPRKMSGTNSRTWAGYTNFVPASGGTIPEGDYVLRYEDAAGQDCEVSFYVTYQASLAEVTAGDLPDALEGEYREVIAVYNGEGALVYFDGRKDGWTDANDIRKEFGSRCRIRICYEAGGGGTVCLLPMESGSDGTE